LGRRLPVNRQIICASILFETGGALNERGFSDGEQDITD
jgi:hypothetical protein